MIGTENIANSLEARQREREYIENLKANLNMVKAYRSKDEADEVGREFRETHKEVKQEYDKVYREKNKDKKRENDGLYRENNKEYLKIQKGLKFECECGGRYTNCPKQEHMRSNKHQEHLKSLDNSQYCIFIVFIITKILIQDSNVKKKIKTRDISFSFLMLLPFFSSISNLSNRSFIAVNNISVSDTSFDFCFISSIQTLY